MAVGVPQDSRAWRTRRRPPGRGEVRTASPAVGAAEGRYRDSQGGARWSGFRVAPATGPQCRAQISWGLCSNADSDSADLRAEVLPVSQAPACCWGCGPRGHTGLSGAADDSEIGKPSGPPCVLEFGDRRWGGDQSLAQHLACGQRSNSGADAVKQLLALSLYSRCSRSSASACLLAVTRLLDCPFTHPTTCLLPCRDAGPAPLSLRNQELWGQGPSPLYRCCCRCSWWPLEMLI